MSLQPEMSSLPPEMGSRIPFALARTADSHLTATGQKEERIASSDESSSTNQTMFQGFEWYCPPNNRHWQRLGEVVPSLASLGVTSMWIPPATKSAWRDSNGYDCYDLYDLGEFNQKGETRTKWGHKKDLVDFTKIANSHGIAIIFDAVLNHKAGADYAEVVKAVKVDPDGNQSVKYGS